MTNHTPPKNKSVQQGWWEKGDSGEEYLSSALEEEIDTWAEDFVAASIGRPIGHRPLGEITMNSTAYNKLDDKEERKVWVDIFVPSQPKEFKQSVVKNSMYLEHAVVMPFFWQ